MFVSESAPQTSPYKNRRHWLRGAGGAVVVLAAGTGLLACSKPVAFKSADVTGADFARGFELADADGKVRTLADFRGKVVVVFFGFTQCPDICPTTMGEMALVKQQLGAQGDKLQTIFITLDPERDTAEVIKAYASNFDANIIALRPTPEQLPALAKEYKVTYDKVAGPTPTSYTLNHSAGSFVYDPQGRLRLYVSYGAGAQAVADDVRELLRSAS